MYPTKGSTKPSSAGDDIVTRASTVPLRAELWHKKLTSDELLVILAMLEIGDSTGQTLYPSIPRIAHYTNQSERTVQRVLHGEARDPSRNPKRKKAKMAANRAAANFSLSLFSNPEDVEGPSVDKAKDRPRARYVGLIDRRILVQIAKANAEKNLPATYRLQIEAIPDKPLLERWKRGNLIPADPIELQKWINQHPGDWERIQRDLRNNAEARIGTTMSPDESAAFMIAIAREHGMPYRLAQLCVKMGRS